MLTREEAESALNELVAALEQRGHKSRIYIVGGAALMLGFGSATPPGTSTPSTHLAPRSRQ